jgi:hypothetical protein
MLSSRSWEHNPSFLRKGSPIIGEGRVASRVSACSYAETATTGLFDLPEFRFTIGWVT